MQYFIRQWANGHATLVAEDGYPLHTFGSVDEAIEACISDCRVIPIAIERRVDCPGSNTSRVDVACLLPHQMNSERCLQH